MEELLRREGKFRRRYRWMEAGCMLLEGRWPQLCHPGRWLPSGHIGGRAAGAEGNPPGQARDKMDARMADERAGAGFYRAGLSFGLLRGSVPSAARL